MIGLMTVASAVLLGGCVSEEEAAEQDFQNVLSDLNHQVRGRAPFNFFDDLVNKAKEEAGKFTLCNLLRPIFGDDLASQQLFYYAGANLSASFYGKAEAGAELFYDLHNYQAIGLYYYGVGHDLNNLVRARVHSGLGWGKHASTLDAIGTRQAIGYQTGVPILDRIPGVNLIAGALKLDAGYFQTDTPFIGSEDRHLRGVEVGLSINLANPFSNVAFIVPDQSLYGWYMPENAVTQWLASSDKDLKADTIALKDMCPSTQEDILYVSYGSQTESHLERARRMASAMLRQTHGLDPLGQAVSIIVAGLGATRDHGGFKALCGGSQGEPDPMPLSQPTCRQYLQHPLKNVVPIPDLDGDGIPDDKDNCPLVANKDQADKDGDGKGDACAPATKPTDTDGDGIPDYKDNCPKTANADQKDSDSNGVGDACDKPPAEPPTAPEPDKDADKVPDSKDNCVSTPNPDQKDSDGDGIGDACEQTKSTDPDKPSQPSTDDRDGDGIVDGKDNCPYMANPDQKDVDGNGLGDACEINTGPKQPAAPSKSTKPQVDGGCSIVGVGTHQGSAFLIVVALGLLAWAARFDRARRRRLKPASITRTSAGLVLALRVARGSKPHP